MQQQKYDLEDRLIEYSSKVSDIVDILPNTRLGNYLAGQMIRSGTSPALHYGEAQSAESKADFIHKMKVCLKELRETFIGLKLVRLKKMIEETELLEKIMKENNELISIFVTSIKTARNNKR